MSKENFESIEEILAKIEKEKSSSEPEEEKLTAADPDAQGLVFEIGKDDRETPSESEPEPVSEPTDDGDNKDSEPEVTDDEEGDADEDDDFDDLDPDSRADEETVEPIPDAPSRIWKTYVPRFTEASETYRLKGDAKIRAQIQEKIENGEEIPGQNDRADIDPTAEYEDDDSDNTARRPEKTTTEENVESFSIYKFRNEDDLLEELDGRTAEDEKKEINELLGKGEIKDAVSEEPVEEPVADEETEDVPDKQAETPDDEERGIPDPDPKEFSSYEIHSAPPRVEDAPSGIEETSIPNLNKRGKLRDSEFSNPAQRDGFKDRFLDSLLSIRIRMIFATVFSAILLVVELLAAFSKISYPVFSGSPVNSTLAIVDCMLAACVFIFVFPEICRAAKHLFSKKPLPELYSLASFLVLLGYTAVVIATNVYEYPLFGFLYAMLALPIISGSLYRTKADFLAFKMVAHTEEKQILDKRSTRELPAENIALDGIVDEYRSKIVRTFRTSFVSDFFKNSSKVEKKDDNFTLIFFIVLSVALISGTVAYFLTTSLVSAISVFTFIFLLAPPAFSTLSGKLTFFHSQKAAITEESAAVGEGGLYSFAQSDVVAFEDTEIFGPDDVNLVRFMLYCGREEMDRVMRQMCALFAVVGGPLDFIFANVIDNRLRHKTATNAVIEDDGLSGIVNGKRIYAGSEDYMRRNGIAIPESAQNDSTGIDTTKIMYGAEDGEVNVKFYIRYSFSEEFTMILPSLKAEGVIPLIYTRDPNVSNDLLKTLSAGSDCMRVLKLYSPVVLEEKVYPRVSAEIVSYGDKINAINMILLSKKYKKFSEKIKFAELSSVGVSIILALVLSFIGMTGAGVIVAALWHVIWCVALRYISDYVFLRDKRKKDKDE